MRTEFNLKGQAQRINTRLLSKEIVHKVDLSILQYVYSQMTAGLLSSVFCATIIYIGLNNSHHSKQLILWAGFFIIVSALRLMLAVLYKFDNQYENRISFWRYTYIVGSLFGGLSWGLAGIILLPSVEPTQQMLLVLMLAGVTAGAVQLSAAVPLAAIMFLIFSVLPFIITIMMLKENLLHLFDLTLSLYLLYSVFHVYRAYRLIKYSIVLTFENNVLVDNLEIANVMLEEAATHDPLTKVANRRLFSAMLNKLINNSKEENKKFALLFFDLDHFKAMNDYYGHEAGDQILLTVVDRLKEYFRKDDIVARLGGDEFAIIIDNVINQEDVAMIAQKICYLIAEPIKWKEVELNISSSIGISIYPADGSNEEDLLRCADKCMYAVKDKGGDNFHFSHDIKVTA